MEKEVKKDLFVFCTHCGELVDVNSAKKTQLEIGRLKRFTWGIGASKKGLKQLDALPPFVKKVVSLVS